MTDAGNRNFVPWSKAGPPVTLSGHGVSQQL
jgi:hypothetical protein